MAENRRVKMTKKMIRDAFLEILEYRDISRVTVTEICEKPDINRSTFYAYYEDIECLFNEIKQDVLAHISIPEKKPASILDDGFLKMLESVFEYVHENANLFRVLIINGGNDDFNHSLIKLVADQCRKRTWSFETSNSKYGYIFCVNGVIGLVKWWIQNDFDLPTREFAEIVFQKVYQSATIFNSEN